MKNYLKKTVLIFISLAVMLCTVSCSKPKYEGKIAVVEYSPSQLDKSDFSTGAKYEGLSLGYQVDTYVAGDATIEGIVASSLKGSYDGVIISGLRTEYVKKLQKAATENKVNVVSYESGFEAGDYIVNTERDNAQITKNLLNRMGQDFGSSVKVAKLWYNTGNKETLDRIEVYNQYEQEGKIETVAELSVLPGTINNCELEIAALDLSQADAIWVANGELSPHVLSMAQAHKIPMYTADVTDETLELMRKNPDIWPYSCGTNEKNAGIYAMRVLANKLKNQQIDAENVFPVFGIESELLTPINNIDSLEKNIGGFNDDSLYKSRWMEEVKEKNSDSLIFISPSSTFSDGSSTELAYNTLKRYSYRLNISEMTYGQNSSLNQTLKAAAQKKPELIWVCDSSADNTSAAVAKEYPETLFVFMDSTITNTETNIITSQIKMEEAGVVAGYIAAKSSSTGIVGFVGGEETTAVKNCFDAFEAGALFANQNIKVLKKYTGSFSDKNAGYNSASELYNSGADVLFHNGGTSGLGVIQCADNLTKKVIGCDYDQRYLASDNVISSVVRRTDKVTQLIMDNYLRNISAGATNYAYPLGTDELSVILDEKVLGKANYEGAMSLYNYILDGSIVITVK